MIKLSKIFESVLGEQDENPNVLEFPLGNVVMTIFPEQKKILLVPQKDVNKIEGYINSVISRYNILNTKNLSNGAVEVTVSPTENEFNQLFDDLKIASEREKNG